MNTNGSRLAETRCAGGKVVHEHADLEHGVLEPARAHRLEHRPLGPEERDGGCPGSSARRTRPARSASRARLDGRVEQCELARPLKASASVPAMVEMTVCTPSSAPTSAAGSGVRDGDDGHAEFVEDGVMALAAAEDDDIVVAGVDDGLDDGLDDVEADAADGASCDCDFDHCCERMMVKRRAEALLFDAGLLF
ncbi:uncharacterized protein PHACADRAFT_192476 [Phanerochaete carnosa HHB-10118-sp]|uniref:Uncharacterized protein n=1 Tax=Phanerochaete carnosa (strain HHB-10118-sp) TaxID=650164 RepID=K5VB13_PHACS|nr:uncharacterized protein PHACADRAFT_192476 [Phanerochaete carnosa HHB-10118-sp]EKM60071.1 hypothetical protein PHACADRAFT_192476 [Phanerochaete carnosa HHB-10118-sp]